MTNRRGRPQLYTDAQLNAALDAAVAEHGPNLTRAQFDAMSHPISAALVTRRLGSWAALKSQRSACKVLHATPEQLDRIFKAKPAPPRPAARSASEIFSGIASGRPISGRQARAMISEMFEASAYLTTRAS